MRSCLINHILQIKHFERIRQVSIWRKMENQSSIKIAPSSSSMTVTSSSGPGVVLGFLPLFSVPSTRSSSRGRLGLLGILGPEPLVGGLASCSIPLAWPLVWPLVCDTALGFLGIGEEGSSPTGAWMSRLLIGLSSVSVL